MRRCTNCVALKHTIFYLKDKTKEIMNFVCLFSYIEKSIIWIVLWCIPLSTFFKNAKNNIRTLSMIGTIDRWYSSMKNLRLTWLPTRKNKSERVWYRLVVRLSKYAVRPFEKCAGTYPQKRAVALVYYLPMNSASIIQICKKYASVLPG